MCVNLWKKIFNIYLCLFVSMVMSGDTSSYLFALLMLPKNTASIGNSQYIKMGA